MPVRRRSAVPPELRRSVRLRPGGLAAVWAIEGRGPRPLLDASWSSPTTSSSCAATRWPTPTRSSTCRATFRPTTTPGSRSATGSAPPGWGSRPGTRPTSTRSASVDTSSCRPSTSTSGGSDRSRWSATSASGSACCAPTSRAAVPAGGGVGHDYYDFADYLTLRYHPLDWLFLQYRTGLFTFDNRRALVLDNSRLTSADGSTHNFGVVARTRNLWFGLFYF